MLINKNYDIILHMKIITIFFTRLKNFNNQNI